MKAGCIAIFAFIVFDNIFMFATPKEYRSEHAYRLAPGGGYVVYLAYMAEKERAK